MEYVEQRRAEYEAWKKEQAAKKEAEKAKQTAAREKRLKEQAEINRREVERGGIRSGCVYARNLVPALEEVP
ncbi:hypothetical protein [Bacillus mycoides]|uniref:hypothetical protein n=1 Tax=Bacillus mycoides TaxID=1405 RepID=UPI003D1DE43E